MNFKDVKNTPQTFEPIPEGRYSLEIEGAEKKKSAKGKNMISVTFKISGDKFKGRKIWSNFVLDPSENGKLVGKDLFFKLCTKTGKKEILGLINGDKDFSEEQLCLELTGCHISGYITVVHPENSPPKNEVGMFMEMTDNNLFA